MQNTLRQMREVSSIGTGPANSPGTVWKKALDARTAQTVGNRLAPSRHSSAATALGAFVRPGAKRLPRLLPAAVHNSHVASMIPREISFPLKTTMSSRMRTIWPMTAVNPSRARTAFGPEYRAPIVRGCEPRHRQYHRSRIRIEALRKSKGRERVCRPLRAQC